VIASLIVMAKSIVKGAKVGIWRGFSQLTFSKGGS
jgi:hypothetical protein